MYGQQGPNNVYPMHPPGPPMGPGPNMQFGGMGRFPGPHGPIVALTVHHPRCITVERSYIANYKNTLESEFQEMTVFQLSADANNANFCGRIIFRLKDEDNQDNDRRLKYSELVIKGLHSANGPYTIPHESKRNDLELVFEKRLSKNEIIFDVELAHPDRNDARTEGGEEPKAEPDEPKAELDKPKDGESKRKRSRK